MRIRLSLSSLAERLRASLFFIPMIAVVGAVLLGLGGIALDEYVNERATGGLPFGLTSTVDSARALLSTIAGATITFAGIAFSVSLLIIQLASSQYSPRVVHTLFRDPFNKRVMGLVVGTFTYCVIVLRSVRSPLEEGGDPVIPNLSVAVAVRPRHRHDPRHRRASSTTAPTPWTSARSSSASAGKPSPASAAEWSPAEPGTRPSEPSGAARRAELRGPLRPCAAGCNRSTSRPSSRCVPEGGRRAARDLPGPLRHRGHPALHALAADPPISTERRARVRAAVAIGDTRTMQQDVSYGLRQLADVALKALSPGINDPTTAQDAIFHAAAVLAELLRRDPPPEAAQRTGGRRLVLAQQPTHDELVRLAFDETRRAAAGQPAVCIYLLEALAPAQRSASRLRTGRPHPGPRRTGRSGRRRLRRGRCPPRRPPPRPRRLPEAVSDTAPASAGASGPARPACGPRRNLTWASGWV